MDKSQSEKLKLILYIRNRQVAEAELNPPDFSGMSFENKCDLKEEYVKWEAKRFKIKHRKIIEGQDWQIVLIIGVDYEEEKTEPFFVTFLKGLN